MTVVELPLASTSGIAGGVREKSALVPAAFCMPRTVSVPSPQLETVNDLTDFAPGLTAPKSSKVGARHIFGVKVPPCSGTTRV